MMAWSRSNGREGRLLQAGRLALTSLREFNQLGLDTEGKTKQKEWEDKRNSLLFSSIHASRIPGA